MPVFFTSVRLGPLMTTSGGIFQHLECHLRGFPFRVLSLVSCSSEILVPFFTEFCFKTPPPHTKLRSALERRRPFLLPGRTHFEMFGFSLDRPWESLPFVVVQIWKFLIFIDYYFRDLSDSRPTASTFSFPPSTHSYLRWLSSFSVEVAAELHFCSPHKPRSLPRKFSSRSEIQRAQRRPHWSIMTAHTNASYAGSPEDFSCHFHGI